MMAVLAVVLAVGSGHVQCLLCIMSDQPYRVSVGLSHYYNVDGQDH